LVFLAAFEDEDVDGFWVCDVSVCLEFLADGVADVGGGCVECEEVDYFWGLFGDGMGWDGMIFREGGKSLLSGTSLCIV
jgi:hypothetical protein